ncbi:hypothetical protein [Caproiciproducens galactitolivorans]|uniref:hypothetical protein n=1 Tax=Caproiciproducens galactitolivorans TaxID=642589 RepID=UPI002409F322|nr:hypothetical protein [Caproiciproducens galactitolivorans]
MIKNPQIGAACWIVIDIWETICPAPVIITEEAEGKYAVRWQISEEYSEVYDGLSNKDLFASERDAWKSIKNRKEKNQCRKRKESI